MLIVSPLTPPQVASLCATCPTQPPPSTLPSPALTPAASHGNALTWIYWSCGCVRVHLPSCEHTLLHPLNMLILLPFPHAPTCTGLQVLCHTKSPALSSLLHWYLFISVHTRWPSLGICFCICLCSDHKQIEEDMTNINLQLLIWAIRTRFCMVAVARDRWFWCPFCHLSEKPPKETHRAVRHLQRIWHGKQEGAAAQAELLLTCENLLVYLGKGSDLESQWLNPASSYPDLFRQWGWSSSWLGPGDTRRKVLKKKHQLF